MKQMISLMLAILMLLSLVACGKSAEPTWQEQYDLGVRYLSEGNYEEAIIAFTAAIEIDPKRAEAYVGLADVYYATGDTAKAEEILAKMIERVDDGSGEAEEGVLPVANRGKELFEQGVQSVYLGDFEAALSKFKEAVAGEQNENWNESDVETVYLRMAQVCLLLGDVAGMERIKLDYQEATGEELWKVDEVWFDMMAKKETYFDTYPFDDPSYSIVVHTDNGDMSLEEYRVAGPQRGWIDDETFALGEYVNFSFCGITAGMTKEEVYEALTLTDWGKAVANRSGLWFQQVGDSVYMQLEEEDMMLFMVPKDEELGEPGGTLFLYFENGVVKEGVEGMFFQGGK